MAAREELVVRRGRVMRPGTKLALFDEVGVVEPWCVQLCVDRVSSAVKRAGRFAIHPQLAARDVVEQLATADPVDGRMRTRAALSF